MGAFTGDSFMKFIKHCPNYKRIVAFEPDKRNISRLRTKCKNVENLVIIERGMSDITGNGNFSPNVTGMYSQFVEEATGIVVPLVKIDDVQECADATFIKMDIEGAEMAALKGAEKTIKRNKPKLAICIYHSNEDMLRIAEYVHEIVPEYRIFMRAHNMGIAENVLYAVM